MLKTAKGSVVVDVHSWVLGKLTYTYKLQRSWKGPKPRLPTRTTCWQPRTVCLRMIVVTMYVCSCCAGDSYTQNVTFPLVTTHYWAFFGLGHSSFRSACCVHSINYRKTCFSLDDAQKRIRECEKVISDLQAQLKDKECMAVVRLWRLCRFLTTTKLGLCFEDA